MDIKTIIQDNAPYLVVAVVIFLLIMIGGMFTVDMLDSAITNNNVYTEKVVVMDKYHDNNEKGDVFLVKTDDNKTYSIVNNEDNYGQRMYNNIQVGKKYELVLKEPDVTDFSPYTYIIQVHNDTV